MEVSTAVHEMKLAAPKMAATSAEERNRALKYITQELIAAKDEFFAANAEENSQDNVSVLRLQIARQSSSPA